MLMFVFVHLLLCNEASLELVVAVGVGDVVVEEAGPGRGVAGGWVGLLSVLVAGWEESCTDVMTLTVCRLVAELDVRVAVGGGPCRVHGVRAGGDEVEAVVGVVLVVRHTLDQLAGAEVAGAGDLSCETGTEELETEILVIRGVETLPHSLNADVGARLRVMIVMVLALLLIAVEADVEHVTAGRFILVAETLLHLTGAVAVLLLLLLLVMMTFTSLTYTVGEQSKTVIKAVVTVGKTLLGLQETLLLVILLLVTLVHVSEAGLHAEQLVILIYNLGLV